MIKYSLFLIILLINMGCNQEPKPLIRNDSNVINLTSIRWGVNDLEELSKKMVQTVLIAKNIDFSKENRYFFETIRNDTHDQINTDMLQNKITSALIKSSKFTFIKQKERADYIFKGKISSIFKKNSRSKDMFFSFNLTLINAQTSALIWSEDIEIRKLYKRSLFSW